MHTCELKCDRCAQRESAVHTLPSSSTHRVLPTNPTRIKPSTFITHHIIVLAISMSNSAPPNPPPQILLQQDGVFEKVFSIYIRRDVTGSCTRRLYVFTVSLCFRYLLSVLNFLPTMAGHNTFREAFQKKKTLKVRFLQTKPLFGYFFMN